MNSYNRWTQVYETENINLIPIYMNFHVKRLVWSGRNLILLMLLARIFELKN